jgi:hypothetical protein
MRSALLALALLVAPAVGGCLDAVAGDKCANADCQCSDCDKGCRCSKPVEQAPGVEAFNPSRSPVFDGKRATTDLPVALHKKNTGGMGRRGPGTGAGLCVYTSAWHAAMWQNLPEIYGFRDWMQNKEGGSWPEKFDRTLQQYCAEKGVKVPDYVQHTGGDEDFLDAALKTGRMPCVTYAGRDDFYSGPIAHMVNLVYMDDSRACILDNNRPGVFLWMTRKEFLQRWRDQGGGWAYVFLAPPPPVYKEGAAPPQSLPFAWESEPVGQCPGGNCNQPTLRRLPALRPVPRPDFAGGPWVTVGPDAATGYDYGANLAKKLGQPLVTYVGYRGPMWAGAVTAYVDALEGFPGPCVVVSKWYGESHRGSLLKGTLAQTVAYLDETSKPVEQKPAAVADDEAADSIPNYGIERKRVSQERRYAVNGREVTRFNAFGAFGADSVADDSTKYSLAVVGDAAYRQKIKSEVGSHFELGGKVLVQYYDPSDWAVSQFALKPGLTLREPDAPKVDRSGKELGSSLDLKDILDILFPKPKPPVDPTPVPTPGPTPGPTPADPKQSPLLIILALILFFLATRNQAPNCKTKE